MKYLVDTSALMCIVRRQVAPEWYELVDRGLIAICEPVIVEALTIADAKRYRETELELRESYPAVPTPENAWELVRAVRQDLADHSAHQGLSVADYLVAATAIRLKLVVLHEDADFETVARVIPQLKQERIGRVS